jgi:hypothetical protein
MKNPWPGVMPMRSRRSSSCAVSIPLSHHGRVEVARDREGGLDHHALERLGVHATDHVDVELDELGLEGGRVAQRAAPAADVVERDRGPAERSARTTPTIWSGASGARCAVSSATNAAQLAGLLEGAAHVGGQERSRADVGR